MSAFQDRRRFDRRTISRPCKVFHWPTQRYLPGVLCDFSRGGARVRIDSPRALAPEDPVDLIISWNGEMLMASATQVRGDVVRCLTGPDAHQVVGVEFRTALAGAQAA